MKSTIPDYQDYIESNPDEDEDYIPESSSSEGSSVEAYRYPQRNNKKGAFIFQTVLSSSMILRTQQMKISHPHWRYNPKNSQKK